MLTPIYVYEIPEVDLRISIVNYNALEQATSHNLSCSNKLLIIRLSVIYFKKNAF